MRPLKERNEVVRFGKKPLSSGLTVATGNTIGVINRREGSVSITPSGVNDRA